MKHDIDLVKFILLNIENQEEGVSEHVPEIDGYYREQILYHIKVMVNENLINAKEALMMGSPSPVDFCNISLTPLGHQFIKDSRNIKAWDKAKEDIQHNGSNVSVGVMIQVLGAFAKNLFGL